MKINEIITEWTDSVRAKRYKSDGTTYKGKKMPSIDDPVMDKAQSFSEFDPEELGYDMQLDKPLNTRDLKKQMQEIVKTLPERDRNVLTLRFGLYDTEPHTLEEVGEILGVSSVRVQQLEVKALIKLRHPDRSDKVRGFLDEKLAEETKKDACYHKVKSRYKVWPSAYASGALVQCRKKGAKNWGSKSK
jgi:RNA polymerase sigma factor (sigma-70 family)